MQGWRREALVYLQGGYGDDEVKLYTEVRKGSSTDTGHKLKPGRFRLDIRKTVPTMRGSSAPIRGAQKGCAASSLGGLQEPTH